MTDNISILIAQLSDKDDLVCKKARHCLEEIGRIAVPQLCELLTDKKKTTRWQAAKALVEIADPVSVHALVKALEDKVFEIRWLAAEALIKIGKPALAPVVESILLEPDRNWRWEGVWHVTRHLGQDEELRPLLLPLIEAFNAIDYRIKVPIEARRLLTRLKSYNWAH